MRFKVLKSSLDGISGGSSDYTSIQDVLREISYHKGWPKLKDLHKSISKWARNCRPGDVYCTQVTAIVAVAVDRLNRAADECPHCEQEGLDYGEIDSVEDGDIEQEVKCPQCGECWRDIFVLSEQRQFKRGQNHA